METGVGSDPPTTLSAPLEDLIVEEVPKVDAGRLGASMSMLQDVIRSVEVPPLHRVQEVLPYQHPPVDCWP